MTVAPVSDSTTIGSGVTFGPLVVVSQYTLALTSGMTHSPRDVLTSRERPVAASCREQLPTATCSDSQSSRDAPAPVRPRADRRAAPGSASTARADGDRGSLLRAVQS